MRVDRDERRGASWVARGLALCSLVAAAIVVGILIGGALEDSGEEAEEQARQGPGRMIEDCEPSDREALREGYYVIQPGDPGLAAISERTCIRLERLIRLNQGLDPRIVPVGACVNIRRDGCEALAQ